MQSLNKNGVSITQTPGEEKFVKCHLGAFRGQIYFQYDYRHTDGELFSTVAKTLDECRRRRDGWIAKKNGKHSKKCTFYTLRFGCSFAAVNTIKPQLL